uniref:Taste receptor type 2 n=1 Tax=Pyxicephalus adspersus TaxID=30357 RepID=A0AAV3AJQ6_PYXAD|nr:TPA: hypothetical protein GDO54_009827 [Pyxicephalus adspersus]
MGIALNGFIVVMNSKTWMRNKCLPPGDQIVTSLCLSRWIYLCLVGVHGIWHSILSQVHVSFFSWFFNPALISMNYISIWIARLLCVYYCVKIAIYKHVVFLYLKEKMPKLAPWFLGLCVLFSLVLGLPYWLQIPSSQFNISTMNVTQNTTMQPFSGIYLISSTPPFIIFTIAFFLTIPSLWKHIRNMSGDGTSFRNPDMKTHYNAIKSITFFFLLHIMFIVCINIYHTGMLARGTLQRSFMSVLTVVYPFLHSAVLIFYNRKLRKEFLHLITYMSTFISSTPPSLIII